MITNTISNKGIKNTLLEKFIEKNNLNVEVLNQSNNANGTMNNDYLEICCFNFELEFKQLELF